MKILIKNLGILLTGTVLLLFGQTTRADEVSPQQANKFLEIEMRIEKLEKILDAKNEEPLDKPNMNSKEVLNWATQVALDIYTYNFLNIKKNLEEQRIKFTKLGYENFIKSYFGFKNILTIEWNKLVSSSMLDGAPIILEEGELSKGHYGYRVKVPLIFFQNKSVEDEIKLKEVSKKKFFVIMTITRASIINCPDGICISSYDVHIVSE